jgi:hypothetical protein
MGAKRCIPSRLNDAGLQLFKAQAMTGTSVLTSQTFNCQNLDNIGIQVDWTGTPTGTIAVFASIDNVNFHAFTFNPALSQPAGSAGGYLISLNQVPFPYVYLQYTNSTGTGVLNAFLSAKDLN